MTTTRWRAGLLGAALSLAVAWPALAAPVPVKHPRAKVTTDADGATEHLRAGSLASFAPATIDAAKFNFTVPGQSSASARLQAAERAFRFTPSGQGDSRKALSIGIASRTVAAVEPARAVAAEPAAIVPTAYNVDLAVGFRGFALSGGYTHADSLYTGQVPVSLTGPRHEAVDLGVSYRSRNWKTSLQLAEETVVPPLLAPTEHRYSVEVGGAYAVTPKFSVSGGVRYKLAPPIAGLADPIQRPDQAVYLGTAISF